MTQEKPILFSAPMVRAILAGTKTQTRRKIRGLSWISETFPGVEPYWRHEDASGSGPFDAEFFEKYNYPSCPYGAAHGDRLWVKETFLLDDRNTKGRVPQEVIYDATPEWAMNHLGVIERVRFLDGEIVPPDEARRSIDTNKFWHKKPSIFMPRWASRITLEVTGVRVERLQAITPHDALAEGVTYPYRDDCAPDSRAIDAYRSLWDSINGKTCPWASNPFVWVIQFRKL